MPPELSPQLTKAISEPRLHTYEAIVGTSNPDDALLLYRLNSELSGAFMFLIQSLEVALRNALVAELDAYWGSRDWLVNLTNPEYPVAVVGQPSNFWMPYQLSKIDEVRKRLTKEGKIINQDAMVADLDFGFWTAFFDPFFYNRLWRDIADAFPNRPGHVDRAFIAMRFKELRKFRNRVAHHEIIVNHERGPIPIHDCYIETIDWICHDKAIWVRGYSRVPMVWVDIQGAKEAWRHVVSENPAGEGGTA